MNVPAIRAALLNMEVGGLSFGPEQRLYDAVVRVGLRVCDAPPCDAVECESWACGRRAARLSVIADILREAGVEVAG